MYLLLESVLSSQHYFGSRTRYSCTCIKKATVYFHLHVSLSFKQKNLTMWNQLIAFLLKPRQNAGKLTLDSILFSQFCVERSLIGSYKAVILFFKFKPLCISIKHATNFVVWQQICKNKTYLRQISKAKWCFSK